MPDENRTTRPVNCMSVLCLLPNRKFYGDRLLDLGTEISTLTASTLWPAHEHESFAALRSRAEKSLANPDELPRWVHFVRIREQSQAAGLDRLTSLADSRPMEPQHLVPSFRFLFYNSLARSIFAEYPDLSQFSGLTQEGVREQFAQADKKAIQLYRERAHIFPRAVSGSIS
jgi:hypothetical protein